MRVLVTNDDGIAAKGIQALRKSLRELDDVVVDVVAPDSNRSATARSITTRSPLWVEEIEFEDGDRGFATEGTPVDCVRFADLGRSAGGPTLSSRAPITGRIWATAFPNRARFQAPSKGSGPGARRWAAPHSPPAP